MLTCKAHKKAINYTWYTQAKSDSSTHWFLGENLSVIPFFGHNHLPLGWLDFCESQISTPL